MPKCLCIKAPEKPPEREREREREREMGCTRINEGERLGGFGELYNDFLLVKVAL